MDGGQGQEHPAPGTSLIVYRPIGYVENAFDQPVAPEVLLAATSRIVLDPALVEGLAGIEPGQRLMVVFHFHRAGGYKLQQHPRGDPGRPRQGVFTLRSPHRPNPIGVTVVEVLAVQGHILTVRGLDAINGTPVLDLKAE
ncbi:MAG: tRNA (N6-threonylcarbamoyladenosine(37)-N6)-methyltransferase TrmO [Armatimonadota bacterium]|nr:tRNA (N6-threonylcarbamoyladenosine(37)-N6)-methyltransferase TrmO [Armatimonadota bacterium]MDR7426590.1 tRNA (N6-threonylcarbamoyladenosine(37)-N6)-methyltransferase TrmO [Armatimonadota bacterium]MDR7463689.1 tRNA (N6-threonylcarbamoyladenosine(37)-N6)-methyltransferase TrmO [Armatimonadota bacterium]MDR7468610.1 tRNA (N6-threonylcarbamoyladenosine(37)-N6)-methyltransferase TrmO [Armatimonadota bacterium]MDR7473733.1 tRNA (N6-threonylcarbamoyladenosine(37)-N6)-methyltransferase TrmO [Arma